MSRIFLLQTLSINEASNKTTTGSSFTCKTKRNQSKCPSNDTFRKSSKYHVIMLYICCMLMIYDLYERYTHRKN